MYTYLVYVSLDEGHSGVLLRAKPAQYKSTSAKPSSSQRSRTDDFHLSYPSRGPRVRCNAAQRTPNTLRSASQALAHHERVRTSPFQPHRTRVTPRLHRATTLHSRVRAPQTDPPRPRPRRARGARLGAARRGRRGRRARRRGAAAVRLDEPRSAAAGVLARAGAGPWRRARIPHIFAAW